VATTSPDNIWTPDSGDDYALTVDLAAMADTIQDALTEIHDDLDPLAEDTGWVPITPAAGFTVSGTAPQVRRIGDQVYFQGDLQYSAGNIPTSTSGVTAFTLPDSKFRPVSYCRTFAGAYGSGTANGTVLITTNTTNNVTAFGFGASMATVWLQNLHYLAA
jgi:hypothetical protein